MLLNYLPLLQTRGKLYGTSRNATNSLVKYSQGGTNTDYWHGGDCGRKYWGNRDWSNRFKFQREREDIEVKRDHRTGRKGVVVHARLLWSSLDLRTRWDSQAQTSVFNWLIRSHHWGFDQSGLPWEKKHWQEKVNALWKDGVKCVKITSKSWR